MSTNYFALVFKDLQILSVWGVVNFISMTSKERKEAAGALLDAQTSFILDSNFGATNPDGTYSPEALKLNLRVVACARQIQSLTLKRK